MGSTKALHDGWSAGTTEEWCMSAQPEPKVARRAITGVDADSRSVIVSDATTPTWVRRPTGTLVMDLWRVDALPLQAHIDSTQGAEVVVAPPEAGVCVRLAVFPATRTSTPRAPRRSRTRSTTSTVSRAPRPRALRCPGCTAPTRWTSSRRRRGDLGGP